MGATVLPVLTPAALALPVAVRMSDPEAPPVQVGDRMEVGDGRLTAPGWSVDIVRTFRPSRVRRSTVPASPAAESMIGELLRHRLGLGPGLTPEADDELAGHLLVAAATGAPVPELEPQLHRTTALSASLLRAAAQGYAVPTVVRYVDAVLAGDSDTAARLAPSVAAIGHTSGPALLRGIHDATSHLDATPHLAATSHLPAGPPLATSDLDDTSHPAATTAAIHHERTVA